jgi:2-oxoacid dehydrogenases acyltransferase (catalytic domain)
VLSLAGHPYLNAHIANDGIRIVPGIHLGIGIDTGDALLAGGMDAFAPIIHPPEVAIPGIGRIGDQPVPADGGITWRKSVTLSLTVDHRAVDGAPTARFLATRAGLLADPGALMT